LTYARRIASRGFQYFLSKQRTVCLFNGVQYGGALLGDSFHVDNALWFIDNELSLSENEGPLWHFPLNLTL
jgi:hypothetical protein